MTPQTSNRLTDVVEQVGWNFPLTGTAWLSGSGLLMFFGIVYAVLQIAYLARKWFREERDSARFKDAVSKSDRSSPGA